MALRFKLGLVGLLGFRLILNCALGSGTVTVCDEANLRAALAGGGTVNFAVDGSIALTNTLVITNNTILDASGHSIVLSGGNAVRIMAVNPVVTATLINLTLANGYVVGSNGIAGPPVGDGQPGEGAAILNSSGSVSLTACTLINNNAVGGAGLNDTVFYSDPSGWHFPIGSAGGPGHGGAICNLGGSLFVTNCVFVANSAEGGWGGIGALDPCNGGDAVGGALWTMGGNVIVVSSSFASNTVSGGPSGYQGLEFARPGDAFGGAFGSLDASVTFQNSTFAANLAIGTDLNAGTVVLHTAILGRAAGSGKGGSMFVTNGSVNCFSCTFTNNAASAGFCPHTGDLGVAQGGAIWSHASFSILQSIFAGNKAIGMGSGYGKASAGEGSGGAIFSEDTISLSTSSFVGNAAKGGNGGATAQASVPGGLGRGGAICNVGTLTAWNCTMASNSAVGGSSIAGEVIPAKGGAGAGGGLFNDGGMIGLTNLTFASNKSIGGAGSHVLGAATNAPSGTAFGGAIYTTNGAVSLLNTILAYSAAGSNACGTLTDLGHNLSSDASAGFSAPGSLNNTDPKLAPLDNYGGPTPTMALLAGSPAMDAGDSVWSPKNDQRGHSRPFGAGPDIGAFESSPPYTVHGKVSGATFKGEVSLTAASSTVDTVNHGSYALGGLDSGDWHVTPQHPDYLFIPASRLATVGPDQIGVNFKAYARNSVSLDDATNDVLHLIFTGTNGVTYRFLSSSDLQHWTPVSTNTLAGNFWEMFLPMEHNGTKFYQVTTP